MKISRMLGVLLLTMTFVVVGCKEATTGAKKDATAANKDSDGHDHEHDHGRKNKVAAGDAPKIADADTEKKADAKTEEIATPLLAKLEPEKRKLAEAQKLCPISDEPLGTAGMGVPIELTIEGQTVFLCCKSCEGRAKKDPEKTLAKVKELVAKNAAK